MFYICRSCRKLIKREIMPPKNEKDLSEWANFPKEFLEKVQNMSHCKETLMMNVNSLDVSDPTKLEKRYLQDAAKLNRLESFILKLVIPFVRVANCRRGRYLMVKGNLILIQVIYHILYQRFYQQTKIFCLYL